MKISPLPSRTYSHSRGERGGAEVLARLKVKLVNDIHRRKLCFPSTSNSISNNGVIYIENGVWIYNFVHIILSFKYWERYIKCAALKFQQPSYYSQYVRIDRFEVDSYIISSTDRFDNRFRLVRYISRVFEQFFKRRCSYFFPYSSVSTFFFIYIKFFIYNKFLKNRSVEVEAQSKSEILFRFVSFLRKILEGSAIRRKKWMPR